MDGRKVTLVGGAITATAMLVVGGVFAVDRFTDVADAPGQVLSVEAIVVATPSPTATFTPVPPTPVAPAAPVIVPAPAPEDVAYPVPEAPAPAPPQAPVAVAPSVAPPAPPDPSAELLSAVQRLRAWAEAQGWDDARIQTLIDRLRAKYGAKLVPPYTPVDQTGHQSESEFPHLRFGPQEEQSPDPDAEDG